MSFSSKYQRVINVKLDESGYPGEELTVLVNPPGNVMDGFWEVAGEGQMREFLLKNGLLLHTTFEAEDGTALALDALPWDVYPVAVSALVQEVQRVRRAINAAAEHRAKDASETPKIG